MITTSLESAINALNKGEVIGLPTETVYGLAANCFNEEAVQKIYQIKNRPNDNPLIVHVKNADAIIDLVIEIPEAAKLLMSHYWPGPLTVLLPKSSLISDYITASSPLVALRSPSHPLALRLLNQLNFPLVAPSANPFMSVSPTNAQHVHDYFGDDITVILDGGDCQKGIESTIVGFEKYEIIIYREGTITEEDFKILLGDIKVSKIKNKKVSHPGMYKRHYAPNIPLIISQNIAEDIKRFKNKKIGVLSLTQIENIDCYCKEVLSESGSLEEAAQHLYGHLIKLDKSGADIILTEFLPDIGIGKAINEKLIKASTPLVE
jgi:L-threonylcarbamoyladenylate synthase